MSTNGQLRGRTAMALNSSGRTRAVATVPTTNRIATSAHSAAAALAQRSWPAPEVFQRRQPRPCAAHHAPVITPTPTDYHSSAPGLCPDRKLLKRRVQKEP